MSALRFGLGTLALVMLLGGQPKAQPQNCASFLTEFQYEVTGVTLNADGVASYVVGGVRRDGSRWTGSARQVFSDRLGFRPVRVQG